MIETPDKVLLSPQVAEQWRRLAGIRANGYDPSIAHKPWPRVVEYLDPQPQRLNRAQRRAK